MKIKQLGEFGLIDRIKRRFDVSSGFVGIGDDCAILPFGNSEIVVSVDALVEGVHFFLDVDPYLLGRKALSVNISDIAAMAAVPRWAFLSLSLRDMEVEWIDHFIDGFCEVADEFGVELLGGDTTSSSVNVLNITIMGENKRGESVKRSTAKVGDLVCVSGRIGCSYAGFFALKYNIKGADRYIEAHLNPTPRIEEALSVKGMATAMIDISDGFIQDCNHICKQSGVGMVVEWDSIPFCDADFITKHEMLCGGEDYQIIACIDRKYKDRLIEMGHFSIVGEVVEGMGVELIRDGKREKVDDCGYKHF